MSGVQTCALPIYCVSAQNAGKLKFAQIESNDAAGVAAVTEWKDSLSGLTAGKLVAIKAADGSGISTVKAAEVVSGDAVATAQIADTTPVVCSFTMPAADVTVFDPTSNTPVVDKWSVKTSDYSVMNIKLKTGGVAATDDKKLDVAAEVLGTEVKTDAAGEKYVDCDGRQITADKLHEIGRAHV